MQKSKGLRTFHSLFAFVLFVSLSTINVASQQTQPVCTAALRQFPNETIKDVYRVGVLAIRGFDAAYSEFNNTFSDYLTATAGRRFDRPIRFELKPLNFNLLFTDVEDGLRTEGSEGVDFIYVNPSAFSCIESQYGSNTLVSQISLRKVGGEIFHLTKFGGVIFARADNDEVNTIADIRDKRVACASISGLGSGQMQFRLMQQRGLSYIQDPKQLVFTSNQGLVVNGVLQGQFDVGFVRTDQIERTKDSRTGQLVNRSSLKIIEGGFEQLDGIPFPFESSTILYPEWNVASLPHVSDDVAIEVQSALLELADHADVAEQLQSCYALQNCTNATTLAGQQQCEAQCFPSVVKNCDTTPEIAMLALAAKTQGRYTGFRSTLSYMELRNMQQETSFIRQEDDGSFRCVRATRIYDAIVCPPGHFLRPQADVERGCADINLDCGGHQCICKPCVPGFDVDIVPLNDENRNVNVPRACPKFSICGSVEQSKTISFIATDNKKRPNVTLGVTLLEGSTEKDLVVSTVENTSYSYSFEYSALGSRTGVVIFEVYTNGEQIPESPFRLQVFRRRCREETGDNLREADDFGNCVCASGSTSVGGTCVHNTTLISSTVVPILVLFAAAIYIYLDYKRKQADSVWLVKPEELHFDDPPAILGRGTFGLVLLAEYRGTQVAVKRVIPPKVRKGRKGSGSSSWRNSLLGAGDTVSSRPVNETTLKEQSTARPVEKSPMPVSTDSAAAGEIGDHQLDAMESGRFSLDLKSRSDQISTKSDNGTEVAKARRTTRRTLNHGDLTSDRTEDRDKLFDFSNLDKAEKKTRSRWSSDGTVNSDDGGVGFDGTQSGAMNQWDNQVRVRVSRRHSMGASTASSGTNYGMPSISTAGAGNFNAIAKRHAESDSQRQQRRGSWGPSGQSGEFTHESHVQPVREETLAPVETRPNRQFRRHSFGGGVVPQSTYSHTPAPPPVVPTDRLYTPSSFRIPESQYLRKPEQTDDEENGDVLNVSRASLSTASLESVEQIEHFVLSDNSHFTESVSFSQSRSRNKATESRMGTSFWTAKEAIFGKGDEYSRLKADFIHEMRHLSKLRHPCITTVMGAVISAKSEPMLVMEYMDHGSLYDLLHNDSVVIDGELVLPILRDIAQGVRFLHAARPQVIHGDLKAQNVLVDSKFRAKVADFGLSQKKRVGATGTPLWMAPELLRGDSDNSDSSDVYSFGIMLYEVYSRKDPYEGEDHLEVLRQVADPAVNKRPQVPMACPPKVASIMTDCLVPDPNKRPSFEELDLRLRRLDVANVEPGTSMAPFSSKRNMKDILAARNEELLFDVFPRHVAEALRDGRRVEAEAFDCVTIFFSDIVGYTTISANLTPKKVSEMLDRLYLKFDALSSHHDVFKIETIGDAYMAVTNLASKQDDHVARLARFAMDAMEAAQETLIDIDEPDKGYVNIRVGFHSGPIVADVIGSRCPKYTLFGDTVNTAARMESNSLPGRIQCSDRSAELLQIQCPELPIASRGKINIKGKGEMHTFWVNEVPVIEPTTGAQPQHTRLDAISENA